MFKNKNPKDIFTIQWAHPVAVPSLSMRALAPNDEKDLEQAKDYIIFDEIFPSRKDVENGKDYKEIDDTFHRAMGPMLTIGQCFGALPVGGIRKPDATHLKFSWYKLKVMYTLLCMFAVIVMAVLCLLRMIYTGVDIYKTISMVFYGSAFMSLLLFLRLAPHWPAIGMSIARRERVRPAILRYNTNKRSLRSRFNICCIAILVPALIEHILALISGLAVAYDCTNGLSLAESYFVNSYMHVFYFVDYSPWLSAILQFINLESTFNWNFMDLFIIIISLGLADRFEQLNKRLDAVKGKHFPEHFWKTAREEYAHLSRLVKEVDSAINEIVLLSFANNLYFICLQLFNSFNNVHETNTSDREDTIVGAAPRKGCLCRPLRGLSHAVYFTFSFGFLMLRFLAVSLSAARINSAANHPASVLYAVPSSSYGTEIQRFLEQVVTDVVAITGLNFFYVTRGLILTITGTIVTYELVLVQFNASPQPVTANITINDSCGIPIKA